VEPLGTCACRRALLLLALEESFQSILPMAVLTQKLLLHADRCMQHEYVIKNPLLAGLNSTLDEWSCGFLAELIEEMELWKWDDATGDFWSRLAKALQ